MSGETAADKAMRAIRDKCWQAQRQRALFIIQVGETLYSYEGNVSSFEIEPYMEDSSVLDVQPTWRMRVTVTFDENVVERRKDAGE